MNYHHLYADTAALVDRPVRFTVIHPDALRRRRSKEDMMFEALVDSTAHSERHAQAIERELAGSELGVIRVRLERSGCVRLLFDVHNWRRLHRNIEQAARIALDQAIAEVYGARPGATIRPPRLKASDRLPGPLTLSVRRVAHMVEMHHAGSC